MFEYLVLSWWNCLAFGDVALFRGWFHSGQALGFQKPKSGPRALSSYCLPVPATFKSGCRSLELLLQPQVSALFPPLFSLLSGSDHKAWNGFDHEAKAGLSQVSLLLQPPDCL